MQSKNLTVTNLCITEDFYKYAGTFTLHNLEQYMDVDFENFTDERIGEIKNAFHLEEDIAAIKTVLMSKIMEAANIECRYNEGAQSTSSQMY